MAEITSGVMPQKLHRASSNVGKNTPKIIQFNFPFVFCTYTARSQKCAVPSGHKIDREHFFPFLQYRPLRYPQNSGSCMSPLMYNSILCSKVLEAPDKELKNTLFSCSHLPKQQGIIQSSLFQDMLHNSKRFFSTAGELNK